MPATLPDLDRSILSTLAGLQPPAAFVTELAHRLRTAGVDTSAMDVALSRLAARNEVLITTPAPPDTHLAAFDLRLAALVPADRSSTDAHQQAVAATQTLWDRWLREFLASHRCQ